VRLNTIGGDFTPIFKKGLVFGKIGGISPPDMNETCQPLSTLFVFLRTKLILSSAFLYRVGLVPTLMNVQLLLDLPHGE